MIAQTLAIEHPGRLRSMVSIMSTTGSRWTGLPSWRAMGVLLGRPPRGREAAIERAVRTFSVIGSPGYPLDEERLRDVAGRSMTAATAPPEFSASCTPSPPRAIAPRRCTASRSRPPSSTATVPPTACPPRRRPGHRQGHPRRPPEDDRRHGPRPALRPLAAHLRRGDRRQRRAHRRGRPGEAAGLSASRPARSVPPLRGADGRAPAELGRPCICHFPASSPHPRPLPIKGRGDVAARFSPTHARRVRCDRRCGQRAAQIPTPSFFVASPLGGSASGMTGVMQWCQTRRV